MYFLILDKFVQNPIFALKCNLMVFSSNVSDQYVGAR